MLISFLELSLSCLTWALNSGLAFALCKSNSIPVQVSMGGGYSLELKNIIEAHSNTFRLAQEIFF